MSPRESLTREYWRAAQRLRGRPGGAGLCLHMACLYLAGIVEREPASRLRAAAGGALVSVGLTPRRRPGPGWPDGGGTAA